MDNDLSSNLELWFEKNYPTTRQKAKSMAAATAAAVNINKVFIIYFFNHNKFSFRHQIQ